MMWPYSAYMLCNCGSGGGSSGGGGGGGGDEGGIRCIDILICDAFGSSLRDVKRKVLP